METENSVSPASPKERGIGVFREFTFPGDSDSMVASRQAVMDFLAPYCASELEEIDILVALQEALANAVFHGCKDDPSKIIHCSAGVDASGFTIVIRDPGPGFEVEAVTGCADGAVNVTEHGRGISLMRSLMDEVTYGRGGAEVCLRKLRAVPASIA